MLYTYYCWLDKTFPGRAITTVAKKVCNDVFFANVAYYSMFYYVMSYLEHQDHETAKVEVKKAFGLSYLAGMLYWIPVMSINFVYVNPQHRVLFIAIGSYVEMNGENNYFPFFFHFSRLLLPIVLGIHPQIQCSGTCLSTKKWIEGKLKQA